MDIERNLRESRDRFPESVVDQSSFLVEEYITGEEFAVDVYFDGEGEPVILNIFTHRFASLSDVSDRLYYTGKDVIEANKARFEAFFRKVNALMGIRDFPAHVELRVEGDRILPIEFNAMRFAGLCTTDMAYFAFGINTVDCYLNNRKPDFDAILRGRGGKIYSMVILDPCRRLRPSITIGWPHTLRRCSNCARWMCPNCPFSDSPSRRATRNGLRNWIPSCNRISRNFCGSGAGTSEGGGSGCAGG